MLFVCLFYASVLGGDALHGARGSPWTDAACIGVVLSVIGALFERER